VTTTIDLRIPATSGSLSNISFIAYCIFIFTQLRAILDMQQPGSSQQVGSAECRQQASIWEVRYYCVVSSVFWGRLKKGLLHTSVFVITTSGGEYGQESRARARQATTLPFASFASTTRTHYWLHYWLQKCINATFWKSNQFRATMSIDDLQEVM